MFFYFLSLVFSKQYAILYAGSNWFLNYRHQADIYTIYNQLLARGFTSSNILLCAYDDIAANADNPYSGQVFHTLDHKTNIYPGSSAINIKEDKVNAQAFYDSISNMPTTSEDYVFIYYDNHGGPGLLGTPVGDSIYCDELYAAFQQASTKNLYKKILFIIEACYSGSVANVLKDIPNMAVITAANEEESSYAAVYDEELGTFLTNEFTNVFIDLIDENPEISVGDLFKTLKEKTLQSHVCFYGEEAMQSMTLSTFIGKPNRVMNNRSNRKNKVVAKPSLATEKTLSFLSKHSKASIRARARLQILKNKAQTLKLETALDLLVRYIDPKNYDAIMNDTKSKVTDTYLKVVRVFEKRIGDINPDDYGKLNVIKALSATHSKEEIIQGIFAAL